jgi:hypothetical protein
MLTLTFVKRVGFSQLFHLFLLAISAQLTASLFATGLTVLLPSVVFVVFGRCIPNAGKTVRERGKLPSAISSFNIGVAFQGSRLLQNAILSLVRGRKG